MVSIRELLGEREIALAVCVDTVPLVLIASPSVKRVRFFHPQPLHAILRGRRGCNDLSFSLCTSVRASELSVFLGFGAASFGDLWLDASRQHGGLIVKGRNASEELRDLNCTAEEA